MCTPEYLSDFDEDSMSKISNNFRRLGGMIPDLTREAVVVATIPMPSFTFGDKSQMLLIAACHLVKFYEVVVRDVSSINIHWGTLFKNL